MSAFNICVYICLCFFLTAYAHISAATVGTTPSIGKLFELLKETLLEYSLMYKQSQIYNCDESGMPLEHKLPRVIAARGCQKYSTGNKAQITILGCCSATGQTIPPMVVFTVFGTRGTRCTTEQPPVKCISVCECACSCPLCVIPLINTSIHSLTLLFSQFSVQLQFSSVQLLFSCY